MNAEIQKYSHTNKRKSHDHASTSFQFPTTKYETFRSNNYCKSCFYPPSINSQPLPSPPTTYHFSTIATYSRPFPISLNISLIKERTFWNNGGSWNNSSALYHFLINRSEEIIIAKRETTRGDPVAPPLNHLEAKKKTFSPSGRSRYACTEPTQIHHDSMDTLEESHGIIRHS